MAIAGCLRAEKSVTLDLRPPSPRFIEQIDGRGTGGLYSSAAWRGEIDRGVFAERFMPDKHPPFLYFPLRTKGEKREGRSNQESVVVAMASPPQQRYGFSATVVN